MATLANMILGWYRRQLGSRAELLRPGRDEWSVYLRLDLQGGQDVLAVFYTPRSAGEFTSSMRAKLQEMADEEEYVDYIDAWVPTEWVETLESALIELIEGGDLELARVRIRSIADLRIPAEVLQELEFELEASGGRAREVAPIEPRAGSMDARRPAAGRERAPMTMTEDRLEIILERVLRRLEGERKVADVEKTVDDLQRRILVLEDFLRYVLSARGQPAMPPRVEAAQQKPRVEAEAKPEVEERPRAFEERLEEKGLLAEEDRVRRPPPGRDEFFQAFIKDNPWGKVLREKVKE